MYKMQPHEFDLMRDSLTAVKAVDSIEDHKELIRSGISYLHKLDAIQKEPLCIAAKAFIMENYLFSCQKAFERAKDAYEKINEAEKYAVENLMIKANDKLTEFNQAIDDEFEQMLLDIFK